jgi:release factor glutamine methyltransferase
MPTPNDLEALTTLLARAGFIAADEEARELLACAAGDVELLDSLVDRRLTGEPLAWIIGRVTFCGLEIRVDPGVYVPRWQSEQLARRAAERLPANGAAIDLCTGTGAIAKTLMAHHPGAHIVASDIDERAVACARANGVQVYCGDLFAPLPPTLEGRVDVVAAVVPYVPTPALPLLQRDTFAFESPLAYDGGPDGTVILRRVLADSLRFLRRGGALLLELGGDQAEALGTDLARLGYTDVNVVVDEDGDVRGIEATLAAASYTDRPPSTPRASARSRRPLTGSRDRRSGRLRLCPVGDLRRCRGDDPQGRPAHHRRALHGQRQGPAGRRRHSRPRRHRAVFVMSTERRYPQVHPVSSAQPRQQ